MAKASAEKSTTRKGEKRRNQIREMAARVFASKGYHGSSMNDIVDELEVTKSTLYHYYRSKEEVLFDILTYMDEEIVKNMEEILEKNLPLFDRFREQIAAHVTWSLTHIEISKVAFRDWSELNGNFRRIQSKRHKKYKKYLKDTIEECRSAGLIPENTNASLLLNFINGANSAANVWFDPDKGAKPAHVGIVFGAMAEALLKDLNNRVKTGCIIPPYYSQAIEAAEKKRKIKPVAGQRTRKLASTTKRASH